MRVLLGIQRLWRGGGTETHVLTLAQRLKHNGHYVELFTTGGEWVHRAQKLGIPVYVRHDFSQPTKETRAKFRRYVRQRHFNIVHVHDSCTLKLVSRSFSGHRNVPPVVFTVHGPYVSRISLMQANRHAKMVICVSRELATSFRKSVSSSRSNIAVVPNGIRQDLFRKHRSSGRKFRRQHKIPLNAFTIGYSGRFTFDKIELGKRIVTILNDYAREHRHIRILVAGRNSKHAVRTTNDVLPIGHVENMQSFYNACDIVIGTARVAAESVACEVPTIAVGKSCLIGHITPNRLHRALMTNFGDHGKSSTWRNSALREEVEKIRRTYESATENSKQVRKQLVSRLSARHMTREIERVYQGVRRSS